MIVKPGDVIQFACFFQDASTGLGVTGLTVTVSVNTQTGNVVAGGSATALDATNQPGIYVYNYTVPNGYYGNLYAYFSTTGSASQRGLASLFMSSAWPAYLDAAISSRLATAGYTAPDNAGIDTLEARLTSVRAGYLDNLTNLDAAISGISGGGGATAAEVWAYTSRTLTSWQELTVSAPSVSETRLTIVPGQTYDDATGFALQWDQPTSGWPSSLSGATIELEVTPTYGDVLTFAGTVAVATGSGKQVKVELTAAESETVTTGVYRLWATLSGRKYRLAKGTLVLDA